MTGYFNFWGRMLPCYGVMIGLGVLVSGAVGAVLIKKYRLSFDNFLLLYAYCFLCGMAGAKLFYLLQNVKSIDWNRISELEYLNSLMQGGFVFYGGLAGGAFGLWLAGRLHKIKISSYLLIIVPVIPTVHGFGRIGCYLSGCCYGIPYDGPLAVVYHNIPYGLCDVSLFPVQLAEAVCNFALAAVLFVFIWKRGKIIYSAFLYLGAYSVIRFTLEFFRYDDVQRGIVGILSVSQWISLGILAGVCAGLLITRRKHVKAGKVSEKL